MLNFYLYSVTSISLTLFYFGFLVFVRGAFLLIFDTDADDAAIRTLASGLGYAVVSFPLWWMHWDWLRQRFSQAEGDDVLGHQFYLFSVVCLNAMAILFAGGVGVSSLVKYLLGAGDSSASGMAASGVLIFTMLLSMALWRHHWRQFTVGFSEIFPIGKSRTEVPKEAAS